MPVPRLSNRRRRLIGRQSSVEPRTELVFPVELEVVEVARDVDEIERPLSENLVRDAEIATTRVSGLRSLHARKS